MRITPQPRIAKWDKGPAATSPVTVSSPEKAVEGRELALAKRFASKLPEGRLPREGYLLELSNEGVNIITGSELGEIRARQTLRQLEKQKEPLSAVRIADWPEYPERALHILPYGPESLPDLRRIVNEFLAPLKCNLLIFEIDYHFQFKSHPSIAEGSSFSKDQIRTFVKECREQGIRVVPQINCLGHQSWGAGNASPLLRAYPEFEEIPDGKTPQTDLKSKSFYCRSWCPLHPEVNKVVFALMDELIDAFDSDAFHIGTDEVFVMASDKCPRCKGKDPGELYAKVLNDLHGHLAGRGQKVMIWSDRLLSSTETGYSEWDASAMGTQAAIDMVPKDIIACDWHYGPREDYPSLDVFERKGFQVMPTIYQNPKAARLFMDAARKRGYPRILGPVTSVWYAAKQMASDLFPEGNDSDPVTAPRPQIIRAVRETLAEAWNRESPSGLVWPAYDWKGPWAVPGKIEAEDFDPDAEIPGSSDSDRLNEGQAYRETGVDIENCRDEGGGYCVGWVKSGEWMAYTVEVAEAGAYALDLRAASEGGGGSLHLELDGKDLSGPVKIPDTEGWQKWTTVTVPKLVLPAGKQRLKLVCDNPGYNLNYFVFRR